MKIRSAACAAILHGAVWGPACLAQTLVTGSNLALKSLNSATLSGSSEDSSYVGTYLTVPAGGATVDFDVNATEDSGGTTPHLNVSIADSNFGFNVSSTSATNYDTSNVTLAAGTYFVSVQRDYANNSAATAPFTVNDLSVNTVSGTAGSTFTNTSSDANALAAANTYITNYRQGPATVHLTGPNSIPLLAGTPVNAKLGNIAFNFGDAVPGTSDSGVASYLGNTNGTYTSQQSNFQSQLNLNFNTVVLENDGKWSSDSTSQNNVDMTGVNAFLNYAQSHQMLARMHNLIWGPTSSGNQQPSWVTSLVSGAAGGNAADVTAVETAISNRIAYYASSGNFAQIDVYNESYHTGQAGGTDTYWNVLGGASGIANVYNQVAAAIAKSGSKAVTFTNEYNVFQNSNDNYANWYINNIDAIRNAGGNVGEIGIEYYPTPSIGSGDSQHSAARIESVLQSLAAQGLPAQVDEFGVASGGTTATVNEILSDTMTLMFGDPTATGFVMWGDENASSGDLYEPAASFYNVTTVNGVQTWTLTPAGQTYQALLGINGNSGGWNTNVNTTTDSTGTISFNGYYGQYYLSGEPLGNLNAKVMPFDLNLQKGTTSYNTTLAKPPNWFFWQVNASGTWSTGSDWTDSTQGGGTPTTAGYTAYFGSSATNYNLNSGAASTVNITTPAINVTIGSAVTLGMIVFDNATTSYTLAGNEISLQGYNNSNGNVAAIYDNNGNHSVTAPLLLLNDTTATIAAANATLTLSNLQTTTAILTKAGAGVLAVNAVNASGLAVTAGTVRVISNGTPSGASVVGSLSISPEATLDLTNNSIVINYVGPSPLAALSADIAAAYDAGKWDQPGITSSTAANSLSYALGINDTGSEVKIAYTLVGDANLDGWVNASDLGLIQPGGTTWSQGDFNYDGVVNADDYALFMLGADESAALGRAVPEPGAMAGIIFAGISLPLKRQGRRK